MKSVDKGHLYKLDHRGAYPGVASGTSTLVQFVNRESGRESEGTTTQECLRMLIDRTWYCNDCLPWSGNKLIVDHLRMALMLHEVRAMLRKVEKGELAPEKMEVGEDGHFILIESAEQLSPYARMPDTGTETASLMPGECSHKKLKSVA